MSQLSALTAGDAGTSAGGRLPVFVFPASLVFYADDQSSQKQVMTLYNPYDFALKFKVLSTAPRKYVVLDAEGTIKPRCCIDIVVRHNAILPCNYGVVDKFRVTMSEPSSVVVGSSSRRSGTSSSSSSSAIVVGRKDVPATLKASSKASSGTGDGSSAGGGLEAPTEHFEQLVAPTLAHTRAEQYSIGGGLQRQYNEGGQGGGGSGPSLIVILAALVCIAALLLPTEGQTEPTSLPSYLHLSVSQKLIFAYALGLVTMVILKT